MTPDDWRGTSARDLLGTLGLVSLHQLARRRGIQVEGKNKSTLVDLVARSLFTPDRIAADLADLEPSERRALDLVILQGGQVSTPVLRRQLAEEGIAKAGQSTPYGYRPQQGSHRKRGSDRFEDILARLGALGLVFPVAGSGYSGKSTTELNEPSSNLFIPNAILAHLPADSLPVETTGPPAASGTGQHIVSADPGSLLRDIYVLAGVARAAPIPLTKAGQIQKRSLVQLDAALRLPEGAAQVRSESDLGRLPLLRSLAEELDLLVASAGALVPGEEVDAFLARPTGERRQRLYDAYRRTARWSELNRLAGITPYPRDRVTGPAVTLARQRVLQEIFSLPAEQWITLAHLVDRMRNAAYEFLFKREVPYHHYYFSTSLDEPNPYHGSNPLGVSLEGSRVDWSTVEAVFIRVVVTEVLRWLGMVDLGFGEDEVPISFRVTEDGATLLQGGIPASPASEPNVVVQPNFQIFAFEPTGEDILAGLDRLAKRLRADQAVEYQLSRNSIYAAQRNGMETAEILAFLERVSRTPLPQNVRRSIEDWGTQLSRIVVRRSTPLLQTIDPDTLDRLYADSKIGAMLGRRVAPTAAIVPLDHLDALAGRLLRDRSRSGTDPIPALSEGDDDQRGGTDRSAISVGADGEVTFRDRLPSIFIRGSIRPFADEGPDGALRLTPTSMRNGARAGISAETMLERIQRFHAGPLPEEVTSLVRRWAKDWGRGALAQVAILQVESEQIMADLLADTELKPFLHCVSGAKTLAVVQFAQVDQVRALLEERGMALRSTLWTR